MQRIDDLFLVRYGHSLELNKLEQCGPEEGVPFISRKARDNGVAAYVRPIPGIPPAPGGELTCAMSSQGGVLSTFVQEQPFYTAFHVARLTPRRPFSKLELLYYCMCIKANRYRYGFGRQANRTLRDLLVPSPEDIPAWVYDTALPSFESATCPGSSDGTPPLDTLDWQPYRLDDWFTIRKGKRLTKAAMTSGATPYIGASDRNNGLTAFIGQPAIHAGNTITVNYNGSVAEAYYQPKPFWCSDDVNVLYPKFDLTPAIGLFIATLIRLERYRFNYGRKWHLDRMRSSVLRLPITGSGEPDWAYMERYINTLPYSSQIPTLSAQVVKKPARQHELPSRHVESAKHAEGDKVIQLPLLTTTPSGPR